MLRIIFEDEENFDSQIEFNLVHHVKVKINVVYHDGILVLPKNFSVPQDDQGILWYIITLDFHTISIRKRKRQRVEWNQEKDRAVLSIVITSYWLSCKVLQDLVIKLDCVSLSMT